MPEPFTMMAIATLAGAAANYIGQRQANDTNRDIAQTATIHNSNEAALNRSFQQRSADQQMAFQERMANTAYQRGTEDLRRAGLNPILALGNPATSPSGANAGGSAGQAATTNVENTMEGFAATAREVMHLKQAAQQLELGKQGLEKGREEIGVLKTTQEKIKADTQKARTEERVLQKGIPEADMKNKLYDVIRPYIDKMTEHGQSNWKKPWNPGSEHRSAPDYRTPLRVK